MSIQLSPAADRILAGGRAVDQIMIVIEAARDARQPGFVELLV